MTSHAALSGSHAQIFRHNPAGWSITRCSRVIRFAMGETILREQLVDGGSWPVYSATESTVFLGHIDDPRVRLQRGDLVIPARGNSIGHVKLVDRPATTSQTTIYGKVIDRSAVDPKFVFYYLSGLRKDLFRYTQTAIPQITVAEVGANPFPLIDRRLQTRIVDFLDRETAKIDTLIAKQEQLIATLQEDRIATIIDAVTRGVSRGTKGLPEKWTMTQLKWVGRLVTGKTPSTADPRNFSDSVGRPWFRPEDYDPAGRESQASMFISNLGQRGIPVLTGESVHVVSIGATLGKIGYVRGSCSTNQQVTAVENPPNAKFLYYALVAQRQNIWAASMGNTLPIISAGRLGALRFPWPPVDEQTYLVAQLDERTDEFDHVIEKTRQAITILREYRSAVITNSVTGKLDVREMV
ncbi:restriction endonuclease subunit S [Gordonia sp. VNK1]|uniref:restriction endonuclease subunit S n=1 Tax=Gordonia oleivorans TaxID=3156618 RepID=UPI0032B50E8D